VQVKVRGAYALPVQSQRAAAVLHVQDEPSQQKAGLRRGAMQREYSGTHAGDQRPRALMAHAAPPRHRSSPAKHDARGVLPAPAARARYYASPFSDAHDSVEGAAPSRTPQRNGTPLCWRVCSANGQPECWQCRTARRRLQRCPSNLRPAASRRDALNVWQLRCAAKAQWRQARGKTRDRVRRVANQN